MAMMTYFMNIFRAIHHKIKNRFNLYHKSNVYVGENPSICGGVELYGKVKVVIGDNVRINLGKCYNPIGEDTRMIFVCNEDAEIVLGNNVAISNNAIVAHSGIYIDDNVMIGGL